ncbi:NAD kinase [Roseivirga misakiensis]|uniref:NAD kinase n=1 Tax=Roseivirga misakiensis TaxID=1563681 RepID=A0A1E5T611_9BACT|nr:NAD kinase [Roseivirga misakiensis]OEK06822.1 NAD kinase [Roseivirga misakiensis]
MRIALHGKSTGPEAQGCINDVFQLLEKHSIEAAISELYKSDLNEKDFSTGHLDTFKLGDDLSSFDFILSLGGDGTILDTITYTNRSETPIVGINLGRLGFLANTPRNDIRDTFQRLVSGEFTVESRSLIRVGSDQGIFQPYNFGLNELTIVKKETSSMIVVHTYVDGDYLNSYWADGLIVATPTGSTGYSLSCGGPLVHPTQKNFIITPVSPHNLNVRPIIVSDTSEITFEIEGRSKQFMVSLDSRSQSIDDSAKISVRREEFEAKLVRFNNDRYFDTLRQKLNWGLDARN